MVNTETLYKMLENNKYFKYFQVKSQYENRDVPRDELMQMYKAETERLKPYMKPYENPFMSIPTYADKMFFMFRSCDRVVVQEKLDGSNAHIRVKNMGFR